MVLLQTPSSNQKPLYARSGWEIPCEFVVEGPNDRKLLPIRAREIMLNRGNLMLRSVSSHPYNCVGMIFAARRAWIEIDHIYDILREDGYHRIQRDECVTGDIVIYKDNLNEPVHVALITQINQIGTELSIRVLSKWGKDAEFEHFVENVPSQFGRNLEFFTERVI